MKLAVFVEGQTENCLREFLQRFLRRRLASDRPAIEIVAFSGAGDYLARIARRANVALEDPGVVGAIGLIDFYGSTLEYPGGPIGSQYHWAKHEIERRVNNSRFRQHFAVHEVEAWLMSDRTIFPQAIQPHLPKTKNPETVNHRQPPGARLKDLYWRKLNKKYKKPIEGTSLFGKLDPDIACNCCPHLRLLLDDLLALANNPK